MRALIVDDVTIMRKLLNNLLSAYAECDLVSNGKEAIQAFKTALQEGTPYDFICLDIMMPGINGLDVLRQIRRIDMGSSKVKILMTTAVSDQENVAKAIQYGCDGYLTKPYDKQNIEKQLIKLNLYDPNSIVKKEPLPENDDDVPTESKESLDDTKEDGSESSQNVDKV